MNEIKRISLKIFMAAIVLILGFGAAKSNALKPVKNLHAQLDKNYMDSSNTYQVYLDWVDENNNSDLMGFNIYEAEDKTDNKDNFKLIATIDLSNQEDWWANKGQNYFAFTDAGYKKATYYVTAFGAEGESEISNLAYCEAPKPQLNINLYQNPVVNSGSVGDEISINIKYESNVDGLAVKYEMGKESPDGMKIDESTGVITWTPVKGGIFYYNVIATFTYDDNTYKLAQGFSIKISECDNPATISGSITDYNGDVITNGWVIAYQKSGASGGKNDSSLVLAQDAAIENGKYEIKNLDKGAYYIMAGSYDQRPGMSVPTWYQNTASFEEATPVEVSCGGVFTADIQLIKDPGYVHITTTPENLSIKLGETFTYDVDAEGGDAEHPVVFELLAAPKNASVNPETGVISFTPAINGNYHFTVGAYIKGYNGKSGMDAQDFTVKVTRCDELSSITLNISDEEGNSIQYGYAFIAMVDSGKVTDNSTYNSQTIEFHDGIANFTDIDGGTYFVEIWGYGGNIQDSITKEGWGEYYPNWYKNAYNFVDATPITVDCGTSFTDEVTLKRFVKPDFYTISGNVTDENTGKPIQFAYVEFLGKEKVTGQAASLGTFTDKKGNYKQDLPNSYSWIVRCDAGGLLTGRMKNTDLYNGNLYYPEYYDNVTDQLEAKVFDLIGNVDNVNFALSPINDFENSISGKVVDSEEDGIGNATVIAYLVETSDSNLDYLYFGRPAETADDGSFKIENMIPGKYVIFAWDNGYAYGPGFYLENDFVTQSWEKATRVEVGEHGNSGDYILKMDERKNLKGICQIFGRVGKHKNTAKIGDDIQSSDALQGAVVYATNMNGNTIASVYTAEDGSFMLNGLAPGTYRLIADKVGYKTYIGDVTVGSDNNSSEQDLLLDAGASDVKDNIGVNSTVLYPNPANNRVTVMFDTQYGAATIKILNMAGDVVISKNMTTVNGTNQLTVPLSAVSQGAYYMTISSGGSYRIIPFAIVK